MPFSNSSFIDSSTSLSRVAIYTLSTWYFGEINLWAKSPSLVIIIAPVVSLSNLPTGKRSR